MEKSKGQMKSRLSYAAGAFGNDVFYATLSTYFIMFVTTHLFNTGDPKQNSHYVLLITNIISILRILEVFIDPLIGNMIDNTNTKYGKFKPWVVGGGIISSITLLLLFTDLGGLNKTNPFLYLVLFGIIYLVMDVFYSIKDIGFWSMIPALSLDSHEREKMATFAQYWFYDWCQYCRCCHHANRFVLLYDESAVALEINLDGSGLQFIVALNWCDYINCCWYWYT